MNGIQDLNIERNCDMANEKVIEQQDTVHKFSTENRSHGRSKIKMPNNQTFLNSDCLYMLVMNLIKLSVLTDA